MYANITNNDNEIAKVADDHISSETDAEIARESVTVYDASVSYRVKDVKLGLVVNNLLDKKYFVPSSVGNYYPGLRRTVMLTSSLSF
jgi:outer membrane receptor protein involved in Fe transport